MIKSCQRPEIFDDIKVGLECIEGYDDDGIYAWMGFDLGFGDIAILHLEVARFSHTVLRSFDRDWEIIKKTLADAGIKQIMTTRVGEPDDHRTWLKFIKRFGFNEPIKQITLIQDL